MQKWRPNGYSIAMLMVPWAIGNVFHVLHYFYLDRHFDKLHLYSKYYIEGY